MKRWMYWFIGAALGLSVIAAKTSSLSATTGLVIDYIKADCSGSAAVAFHGTNPGFQLRLFDQHLGQGNGFVQSDPLIFVNVPAGASSPYNYSLDLTNWNGGPHYRVDAYDKDGGDTLHTKSPSLYCGSATATPTYTAVPSSTPTASPTPTSTTAPSSTATNTKDPSATPSNTTAPTSTQTSTLEPSATPSETSAPSSTPTGTDGPTSTPTDTQSASDTPTATQTLAASPTNTATSTQTTVASSTPESSPTPTQTRDVTQTPTGTTPPPQTSTPTETGTPPTETSTPATEIPFQPPTGLANCDGAIVTNNSRSGISAVVYLNGTEKWRGDIGVFQTVGIGWNEILSVRGSATADWTDNHGKSGSIGLGSFGPCVELTSTPTVKLNGEGVAPDEYAAPIGEIRYPSLGLNIPIAYGTQWADSSFHHALSVAGLVSDNDFGIHQSFAPELVQAKRGDRLVINGQVYQVDQIVVVEDKDDRIMQQLLDNWATITTCTPDGWVNNLVLLLTPVLDHHEIFREIQ